MSPSFCNTNFMVVARTPNPYLTDGPNLIEDAS